MRALSAVLSVGAVLLGTSAISGTMVAFEPVPSATGVAGSYLGTGVTATPLARGTG